MHAVSYLELAGADNITCHLREDRRHIQDNDVFYLKEQTNLPLNFEMAATEEMVAIALKLNPLAVTLVPEKRQELTTEGGLAFTANEKEGLSKVVETLREQGIVVSLFVDPDKRCLEESKALGVQAVEIHTGEFCEALDQARTTREKDFLVEEMSSITSYAKSLGFQVHVGHGISYTTAQYFPLLEGVEEANIGHAIIARALFCGLERAVIDMKKLLNP